MTETIVLSPTAFEVACARLATRTPREIAREQKKVIKTLMNAYALAYHKGTAGHQYAELCKIAGYCQGERIETPLYVRWMLLLHREGESMTIMSVSGRRRFRVSPQDHTIVQMQPKHGARWVDYRRVNSLQQASKLVLELAQVAEDETNEFEVIHP